MTAAPQFNDVIKLASINFPDSLLELSSSDLR